MPNLTWTFCWPLFVEKFFLIIQQGPWCFWRPGAIQSASIMPWWQHVLGQGSRTVRFLCHTSLQAGHGQPIAQLGVLTTQGSVAHLQDAYHGCLATNSGWCHLFICVWLLCDGAVDLESTAKLTKQHEMGFCYFTKEEELSGDPTMCPFGPLSCAKSKHTHLQVTTSFISVMTFHFYPSIHFLYRLIRQSGRGGAGAYPSGHRAKGGVISLLHFHNSFVFKLQSVFSLTFRAAISIDCFAHE